LKKLFVIKSWLTKNCTSKNSSKEMIQIYRIFARFVTRFTTRKSCGKLLKRNLTLTSRWIGWLTLSGLPLLAFPPPPPKHFIHGIPGAFPRLCLLFAIPSSLLPSLSCDSRLGDLRLPSSSPLLKIPRTSHLPFRNSFVSDASRALWRNFFQLGELTIADF